MLNLRYVFIGEIILESVYGLVKKKRRVNRKMSRILLTPVGHFHTLLIRE